MRYAVAPSNVEIIFGIDGGKGGLLFVSTLKNFLFSFKGTKLNERKHLALLNSSILQNPQPNKLLDFVVT
jgi:hypothetical protein